MDPWFYSVDEWIIYALIVLVIGVGAEGGAALARWRHIGTASDADRFLSTMAAPSIGLLALMIGFTFSMAVTRFEARKSALVTEANAIGTAALRGRMLPEPYSSAVAPMFKEYAKSRVASTGQTAGSASTVVAINRALELQEQLWRAAIAASASNPQVVPSGLFVQALNSMIDIHAERLAAGRNHVPSLVLLTLIGIAIASLSFAAYGLQSTGLYRRAALWVMVVMIGSVILLVFDLDRPQGGFITVNQQPLLDLIDSMS